MMPLSESPLHRSPRILIIDDDALISRIYKRKFEAAGFEVDIEIDGSEGYYRIFKGHFDAVLLDLLLPGMDGPSIIRKFRAQSAFASLPIIVFTNAFLSDIGRDAAIAGATQIFDKGIAAPEEIVDAFVKTLKGTFLSAVAPSSQPISPFKEGSPLRIDPDFLFSCAPASSPTNPDPAQKNQELAEGSNKVWESFTELENAAKLKTNTTAVPKELLPKHEAMQDEDHDSEIVYQATLRASFLQKCYGRINKMQNLLRVLGTEGQQPKVEKFIELARISHTISGPAAIVGLDYLAHLSSALEALSWELFETPSNFALPTQRVIARVIDLMSRLADSGTACQMKDFSRFNVLVVDDNEIDRNIIIKTLDRVKLSHVATGNPESALALLQDNEFDLVITDVKMDGMSGFEFCSALRKMEKHHRCPLIFVSSLSDFQSKVLSVQLGGEDFIIKPFVPMELAIKVLIYMIAVQVKTGKHSNTKADNGGCEGPARSPFPESLSLDSGISSAPTASPSADLAALYSQETLPWKLASDRAKNASQSSPAGESEARREILASGPEALKIIRGYFNAFVKKQTELSLLDQLSQKLNELTGLAAMANLIAVHAMGHALAALIADFRKIPGQITSLSLKTISQALDLLIVLLKESYISSAKDPGSAHILAVTDAGAGLTPVRTAMELVGLKADTVETSADAVDALKQQQFDLVLIDVRAVENNGLELGAKIHRLPEYKTTPVIFLMETMSVQHRLQTSLHGFSDCIAKPYNLLELGVKALLWVLKGQLGKS